MSQANIEGISNSQTWEFTKDEILALSDRLFSRGISTLTTMTRREQQDSINASRLLVQLVLRVEAASGKTISSVMLFGGSR